MATSTRGDGLTPGYACVQFVPSHSHVSFIHTDSEYPPKSTTRCRAAS